MRVVSLVTRFPAPPWRGDQVRAYHHLRLLGRRHEITLVALGWRPPGAAARAEVESFGVRVLPVPLGVAAALPALARGALGDRRPFQVLLYARRRAAARVARLIAAGAFDVVHAQLVRSGPYLPPGARPPVVLDLVDALSANMSRRAAADPTALGRVAAWEAARLARYEAELIARAATSLVVSEAERGALGADRVRVVPNGVDVDAFQYCDRGRSSARLIFAGNLGYFPNVDAAVWLATEVLPAIRERAPAAELRLVGARPVRAVLRLASTPGVSVAGAVPSMAPELAAATVAVIPMRAGSGVQNKILEAMAAGLPVVTTARAAAALGARPDEHCLVADDTRALAAATLALLGDPSRARTLARAARTFVETHHRWDTSANAVEQAWRDARAGTSTSPP